MSLLAGLRAPRVFRSDAVELIHPSQPVQRRDSVVNDITGMGGLGDKGQAGRPNPYVLPLNDLELESLYANNGIARRIVDIFPSRATRRGWTVPDIGDEDRRLKTWDFFRDGLTWARLYGGSAGLMVTEDDVPAGMSPEAWLREPLDLKRVGKVLALRVFDAVEAWPSRWCADIRSPRYGLPEMWQISSQAGFRATVHASRIVHFRGARRPPNKARTGWQSRLPDDSCFQPIWDSLRRLEQVQQAGATIAQELREGVLSVGGLAAKATSDEGESLWDRFRNMALVKGLLGLTVIDSQDTYTNLSNPPTGYSELSGGAWTHLSAVTSIPQTVLMGESPGGLSSDGESAQEGFRQSVSDYQSVNLSCFEQLYAVVYSAQDGPTRGIAPEGWAVEFASLDEPSEKMKADTQLVVAQADEIRIRSGVLRPETVTRSRHSEAGWNFELEAEEVPDADEEVLLLEARRALAEPQPNPQIPLRADSDQSVCILIPAADPGLRAAAESAIGQTLVPEDEPHITLLFLGDVDPASLPEITAVVAEEAKASRVSTIQNAAIRPFPVGSDGTPVVLEFEDGYELAGLHDRLLVRLAHLISAKQFAKYRIHLTLGYAPEPLETDAVTALVELEVDVKVPVVEVRVMQGRKQVSSVLVGS